MGQCQIRPINLHLIIWWIYQISLCKSDKCFQIQNANKSIFVAKKEITCEKNIAFAIINIAGGISIICKMPKASVMRRKCSGMLRTIARNRMTKKRLSDLRFSAFGLLMTIWSIGSLNGDWIRQHKTDKSKYKTTRMGKQNESRKSANL